MSLSQFPNFDAWIEMETRIYKIAKTAVEVDAGEGHYEELLGITPAEMEVTMQYIDTELKSLASIVRPMNTSEDGASG